MVGARASWCWLSLSLLGGAPACSTHDERVGIAELNSRRDAGSFSSLGDASDEARGGRGGPVQGSNESDEAGVVATDAGAEADAASPSVNAGAQLDASGPSSSSGGTRTRPSPNPSPSPEPCDAREDEAISDEQYEAACAQVCDAWLALPCQEDAEACTERCIASPDELGDAARLNQELQLCLLSAPLSDFYCGTDDEVRLIADSACAPAESALIECVFTLF